MSCLRDHFQKDHPAPGTETPRKSALKVCRYHLLLGNVSNGLSSSAWPAHMSSTCRFSGEYASPGVEYGGDIEGLSAILESSPSAGPRETSVGVAVELYCKGSANAQ